MSNTENDSSRLMKAVEAIAISPDEARQIAERYEEQARSSSTKFSDREIIDLVTKKIINRYKKLAAAIGGATSLSSVIPGIGTAVAMVGGGLADVTASMKIQIDMTMCLCMAINKEMTNEDAKHLSFIIALSGSIEGIGKKTLTSAATKAAVNVVKNTIKGATLETIKQLFKIIGIRFTQKALLKSLPFGVGVAVSSGVNYTLTAFVGKVARDVLWNEYEIRENSKATA